MIEGRINDLEARQTGKEIEEGREKHLRKVLQT